MDQTKCPIANNLECSNHGVDILLLTSFYLLITIKLMFISKNKILYTFCSFVRTRINVIANLDGAEAIVLYQLL